MKLAKGIDCSLFRETVAASAPVSERSVKLRKTKRLTSFTRLGFIVPNFTAIPL